MQDFLVFYEAQQQEISVNITNAYGFGLQSDHDNILSMFIISSMPVTESCDVFQHPR